MSVGSVDQLNLELERFKIRSIDLARTARLSKSTVSKILNKKYDPTISKLICLWSALDALLEIRKSRAKDIMKLPVTVSKDTTIESAVSKLEEGKFSQLPVVWNGKLVGMITEKSILLAYENQTTPGSKVSEAMGADWAVIGPGDDAEKVRSLLKEVQAVVIVDHAEPVGIITRTDFVELGTGSKYDREKVRQSPVAPD